MPETLLRRLQRKIRSTRCSLSSHLPTRADRSSLPYPVNVSPRDPEAETFPLGGDVACFDTPAALQINRKRLEHLQSLQLNLAGKSVLDVGCGVGHLAQFFVQQNCRIVCVDGREENIHSLRSRYPHLEAHVANVEVDSLTHLGSFDIVFCYGLLYHLENPLAGLRQLTPVCKELLLLETIISDSSQPIMGLADEPPSYNQSLAVMGCRPSPSFVTLTLNRLGFPYVYAPVQPPDHPDYRFDWKDNLDWQRDGHPLRCVFVAARSDLHNPRLQSLLTKPSVSPDQP